MGVIEHGGPDALGVPRWDFSTNANACGPAPAVLRALRRCDAARYPDPAYQALRESLAALHGVRPERIVISASASEFIVRMTAAVARRWPSATVGAPRPGYADYAAAARAAGLALARRDQRARLAWHAEPASPDGGSVPIDACGAGTVQVIDCAYAPLRLTGAAPALPAAAWQLWTPNKALGLPGVRAAYAIAPAAGEALRERLAALAPSWPLGAHGVALLESWTQAATHDWLRASLGRLARWKQRQLECLSGLGWHCRPSVTPFFVARWDDGPPLSATLARLRAHGVKLRDAASLGLPGWERLSVQPPPAQRALLDAWRASARPRGRAPAPPRSAARQTRRGGDSVNRPYP